MRVTISAVGRLRAGPERTLIDDYLKRFDRTGRNLGLGPTKIIEVEDKKRGGKRAEAALLEKTINSGAVTCALDERGKTFSSPQFADRIAQTRDNGTSEIVFLIGGADGIDRSLVAQVDFVVSFGSMVWPHMLARVMLCEQLYRAASILAQSPYHRE